MDKKKAEQAKNLLKELEKLQNIKFAMEEAGRRWWSFLTSDIMSFGKYGLTMPDVLREEFAIAVNRSIEQVEKQIDEL